MQLETLHPVIVDFLTKLIEAGPRTTSDRSAPIGSAPICVDEHEAARLIGMSLGWVRKDRRTKRLLPFFRVGDRCMYNPARILEALNKLEEGGVSLGRRNRGEKAKV